MPRPAIRFSKCGHGSATGADIVRLTQSPCHPAVLAVIPEGHRGPFRLALVTLAGETHHACHALRVDGLVMFVFDDGSSALVPVALFKPAHDI